ncbi:helix-turn-helix domain-containing protein [Clostridium botulinum]|uniref:helix-turn-helix domain-containing protein n=1 Tax=Clostridium botulinum TaxID=1491 RepID=UPI0005F9624B|nr:helix-turn-helix transcriptional regulator [Clostridium botulinum]KEI86917.1 DNA-binding protein [Clostridium botulinum B2 267]MBY6799351.1 helix-turn-helix domain-containing protein [Clostridium botulinum]MBY6997312.1 helix-turn-helix domain-containing protein [Clostridium botulinum]MBY7011022.1 helix-turn-helix domain-containing protein [Clostridium botulinum]MCR1153744.1 helix-turn-helix domain-containing protein [Clostridium botulinum]
MEKLLIGEVIYKLRKEKGITQEQLANFIGVSTAAVSKWESGTSYPDITLLPVIATLFNITIDTLLNFKIELSDEEVMDIFNECEKLFSNGEIHKAIDKSKKYIINYTSSYYLKLRIGFLFIMYSWKSTDEEKCKEMIGYSIKLFEDVSKNCTKIELVEQALFQLGALYPSIGEEDKAVEALNKINKSKVNPDMLLANIYMEKNELKKAREIMQSNLYKSISDITTACFGLANSYMKDEKNLYMVEKYYNLSINIKKIFSPNGDSILELYMEYLSFAQVYLKFNDSKKAIDMLHKMIYDMKKYDINEPENFRDIWCFNEISNGKRTITMNLYENIFKIFEAPEFDLIRESKEFVCIMNDLKILEEKSLREK